MSVFWLHKNIPNYYRLVKNDKRIKEFRAHDTFYDEIILTAPGQSTKGQATACKTNWIFVEEEQRFSWIANTSIRNEALA